MSGTEIAEEIAAALAEAGEAVGSGPLTCTIRRQSTELDEPAKPWDEVPSPGNPPSLYPVVAIEDIQEVRGVAGTLIGVKRRTLTINATGVEPRNSDRIAVGVSPDDVTSETVFEEIIGVTPTATAGVALMYELELAV